MDPYAFPQDEKPSAGEILSNTSSPSVSNNPLDVKKPPDDKKEPSVSGNFRFGESGLQNWNR